MNTQIKSYFDKNGIETRYAKIGNGKKSFVMIPGISVKRVTDSAEMVAEAYEMFLDEFTIYLFDRPTPSEIGTTIKDIAENLYEVLTDLNIKDGYFFGASQGGMILQELMLNHKDIIKKAVLGSTLSRVDESTTGKIDNWLNLAEKLDSKELHLAFYKDIYSEELITSLGEGINALIPDCTDEEFEQFKVMANSIKSFDVYGRLKEIEIRALVLGSKKDKVIEIEKQVEMAKVLNAESYFYEGFGHAVYDEAPDYKQRIYDFFTK